MKIRMPEAPATTEKPTLVEEKKIDIEHTKWQTVPVMCSSIYLMKMCMFKWRFDVKRIFIVNDDIT